MPTEKISGYRFAGDIDIKRLALINQVGEVIDLDGLAKEVSVYQDIESHYLTCDVVINDSIALLNSSEGDRDNGLQGGFNGGEVLVVSYKTKSDDLDYITHMFGIYNVTDRQRLDDKGEAYVLECISIEAYRSSTKTVSRAFGHPNGNLISNMIRAIVNEFVYDSQVKDITRNYREVTGTRVEKTVTIDPTNGLQRYIIPNMTPDDAIDFLSSEADSDNHIPNYVFYENSTGYNFRDVNSLVQQEPKDTYTYVSTNVKDEEKDPELAVRDYQKIISFYVPKQTNILENTIGGLYRSKTINLDILKKNKTEYNFNYDREFDKFNTLQNYKIPGVVDGIPLLFMMQSRTGHDADNLFASENHLPKRTNSTINRKVSFQKHISNFTLELTVHGNSELNAGDVIYVRIPNATTVKEDDGKRDKYLSGKYLITSVRHKFGGKSGTQFVTFLECIKDTGIDI
jgi:hypothetical protein